MHMFFVNTSVKINASRHGILFDDLRSDNKIIIFERKLSELKQCAQEIAEMITRRDDITEEYNIIVYTATVKTNEEALGEETVIALWIEEDLFAELYKKGRKPNKALIIYGENFTREAKYGRGSENRKKMYNAVWALLPLPTDIAVARAIIEKTAAAYGGDGDPGEKLIAALTTSTGSERVPDSVTKAIGLFCSIIAGSVGRAEMSEDFLYEQLFNAVTRVRKDGKAVTGEKIQHAHLRLEDSDIHAWNRTVYRLLLFVHLCASKGDIVLVPSDNPVSTADGGEGMQEVGSLTLPAINMPRLSGLLKERISSFQYEAEETEVSLSDFPRFKDEFTGSINLLSRDIKKPDLAVKDESHKKLSTAQLEKSVMSVLEDIAGKNKKNRSDVSDYITSASDHFGVIKEPILKNISRTDSAQTILNDKLTADHIAGLIDEADAAIVRHRQISVSVARMDAAIQETRSRTEYYFDCMKKRKTVLPCGILFVLLFAVPYGIMQRHIFADLNGLLFFAQTTAAAAFIFFISYLIFIFAYKMKVKKEIRSLIGRYTETTQDLKKFMDEFACFITQEIPLSYSLNAYQNDFHAYLGRRKNTAEYRTYHIKHLRRYKAYAENLLTDLDINGLGNEPEPIRERESMIEPGRDIYCNNTVYTLVGGCPEIYDFGQEGTGG